MMLWQNNLIKKTTTAITYVEEVVQDFFFCKLNEVLFIILTSSILLNLLTFRPGFLFNNTILFHEPWDHHKNIYIADNPFLFYNSLFSVRKLIILENQPISN